MASAAALPRTSHQYSPFLISLLQPLLFLFLGAFFAQDGVTPQVALCIHASTEESPSLFVTPYSAVSSNFF